MTFRTLKPLRLAAIASFTAAAFVAAPAQAQFGGLLNHVDDAIKGVEAVDKIGELIGPAIRQAFNDQSIDYFNYQTYDLFVPEYGDTVPSRTIAMSRARCAGETRRDARITLM